LSNQFYVVSGDDDRVPGTDLSLQKSGKRAFLNGVQATCRLVKQKRDGLCGQDGSQGHALPFAHAQIARVAFTQRGQAERVQPAMFLCGGQAVRPPRKLQLFANGVGKEQAAGVLRYVTDVFNQVLQPGRSGVLPVDNNTAAFGPQQSYKVFQQSGLSRAVGSCEGDEFPLSNPKADSAQSLDALVIVANLVGVDARGVGQWCVWGVRRTEVQLGREGAGLCYGEGQRFPTEFPGELDHWWTKGHLGQHLARRAGQGCLPCSWQEDQAIGVRNHSLQAVLGKHDGEADFLLQALQSDEHVLSCLWVELRGGLVQHKHFGSQGQGRADSDTLFLAR
jgi:hypothetical protein